ncbi:MAG TPA: hypothetical protein ENJ75_02110 [Candidatus Kaiserbacteria bacterium]|nr:hypothetical protein [Candidatus Kaiserbacteria bacterium]
MTDELRTLLGTQTYNRADVAYHIGVLKEFLEYLFFTEHVSSPNQDTIASFAQKKEYGEQDTFFLERLPESFFKVFSQESFYKKLEQLADEAKNLPTLSLVVPVVLKPKQISEIGTWAREKILDNILLDIDVDPTISAGCQIVWNDILYDFGLNRQIKNHQTEIENTVHNFMHAIDNGK